MNPQAGWYADPSGDVTRLRFWDGAQWTDQYMPAPQPQPQPQQQPQQQAQQTYQQPQQTYQQAYQQMPSQQAQYAQQPYASVPNNQDAFMQAGMAPGQIYPMTDTDRTLRLIAFIWNIFCTVACAILLIPLAWMIPMTVHTYGIYKGTKPNTVAFGVCTLLFIGVVSGVLLLCSSKDE